MAVLRSKIQVYIPRNPEAPLAFYSLTPPGVQPKQNSGRKTHFQNKCSKSPRTNLKRADAHEHFTIRPLALEHFEKSDLLAC